MDKYIKEHLEINFNYVLRQIEKTNNRNEFSNTYYDVIRFLDKTPGVNVQEYLTDLLTDYTEQYQRLAVLTVLDVVKSESKKNGYWGEGMGCVL